MKCHSAGPTDFFDVLVVGAGPAGSATAISLSKAAPGLRIGLVDKAEFPRDKACGDGLGPGVVAQLQELAIAESEIPSAHRIHSAEIHGTRGLRFHTDLAVRQNYASYGLTVRRVDFDERLRQRAISMGVKYQDQKRFTSLEVVGNEVVATFLSAATSDTEIVRCRLLVGADGANSRVRKQIGVKTNPPSRTGIAIRAYCELPSEHADRIYLSFEDALRPGYGWCFPFADGTANVGVGLVVRDYRKQTSKLPELLDQYVLALADRGIPIGGMEDAKTHILPHGGRLSKLTGECVALVGDAASMINPLSGEGIVYGMRAGNMLARIVGPILEQEGELEDGLSSYEHAVRTEFRRHLFSNYIAHRMLRSSAWSRFVLGGASVDPTLQELAVDLMFGDGYLSIPSAVRVIRSGSRYLCGIGR